VPVTLSVGRARKGAAYEAGRNPASGKLRWPPSYTELTAMSGALTAIRVSPVLGGDRGCRPFPRASFSVSSILPPLRSGKVSLDEAERFTAQSTCQRRYAPMVFGIIPECRSASLRN